MIPQEILPALACIRCRAPLRPETDGFRCERCGSSYPVRDGRLWALEPGVAARYREAVTRGFGTRLIALLRRFPRLYRLLYWTLTPIMPGPLSSAEIVRRLGREKKSARMVNIASGTMRIAPQVLNIDILPYEQVDMVADIAYLPFSDASLDLVISETTLEHIPEPERAFHEIRRVVRPGGWVYVTAPFLYPYHESPGDYSRWTKTGLAARFPDFEPFSFGAAAGPMTALISFLMRFFALPFSFRSRTLYTLLTYGFMVLLSPLKLLDPLFRISPFADEVASVLYFFGRKR